MRLIVFFRIVVGDNVTVGEDVIVQGPASETEDPENLTLAIPDGAVVTDEASLREALSETPQEMPDTGGVELESLEGMDDH